MKISISYPPIESSNGIPLLSQNRQFQWFNSPTYIYPMIPAYAATLLKKDGHDVFWDDGIAEKLTYEQWFSRIARIKPAFIAMETKTPVVKMHWKIINHLKDYAVKNNWDLKIVLFGDHVTALPEESMRNSSVDFIVTGGDYDFLLLSLCKTEKFFEPGIWYREKGIIKTTGKPLLKHNLDQLPMIDRSLTQWEKYAYKNGNFKYTPGTYIMAGRDCWWGRCSFCSWTTLYPGKTYRTVSVERHLDEVGKLIKDFKVREIFDDSGCFPKGEWLEDFCKGIIDRGYHKKVVLGCNTRVGAINNDQFKLMKQANFRFILIGLESMNHDTLERLNKGINVKDIEKTIRGCKAAGLEPHITTMVGYPWENREEAKKTIDFAKRMFSKGFIDTLQATIVVPYPGTPLFSEAVQKGWLISENWDDYDMKKSVLNSQVTNEDVHAFTQGLYKAAVNPFFIGRKIFSIRNIDDIKFLARAGLKIFAHIADFKKKRC
jgi:radical SAM superfamily enzyme YgiQ (UPF0313 family)